MAKLKASTEIQTKNEEKVNYKIRTVNERTLLIYHDDNAFSLPLL